MRVPLHQSMASRVFALICIVLLTALTASMWQFASLSYLQFTADMQEKTSRSAKNAALTTETILEAMIGQMLVVTNSVGSFERQRYQEYIDNFIRSNNDFVSFHLVTTNDGKASVVNSTQNPNQSDPRYVDKSYNKTHNILAKSLLDWATTLNQTNDMNPKFRNLSADVDLPILGIAIPFKVTKTQDVLWAILTIWHTKIYSSLPERKSAISYLIDKSGKLITANDLKQITQNKAPRLPDVLKEALKSQAPSGLRELKDTAGNTTLSAFARIPRLGLIAYAETSGDVGDALIEKIIIRGVLWAIFLLLIAAAFTYVTFSKTLANLQEITEATLKIATGNFKIFVPIRSRNEVGLLGQAINHLSLQAAENIERKIEAAKSEVEKVTVNIVQKSFFTEDQVSNNLVSIHSHFEPATPYGGNWWKHDQISDCVHLVIIADATAQGIPAALVTAMTYATSTLTANILKRDGHQTFSPSTLLQELNHILWHAGKGRLTMTCLVMLIDVEKGEVAYANAGHNFPVIIPQSRDDDRLKLTDGSQNKIVLDSPGDPAGLALETQFFTNTVSVMSGDKVLLYTDGLFECLNPNGEPWGIDRFMQVAENNFGLDGDSMSRVIMDTSKRHRASRKTDKDITFVLLDVSHAGSKTEEDTDDPDRVQLKFDFTA